MSLVDPEEFAQFTRLRQLGMPRVAELITELLKLDKVNAIYDEFSDAPGAVEFADAVLERLGVEVEISEEELKRIPKTGPFISVSNHPFGGIDGIILIRYWRNVAPISSSWPTSCCSVFSPWRPISLG